jgi:hypothetical protein
MMEFAKDLASNIGCACADAAKRAENQARSMPH